LGVMFIFQFPAIILLLAIIVFSLFFYFIHTQRREIAAQFFGYVAPSNSHFQERTLADTFPPSHDFLALLIALFIVSRL
ncbi:MAG: hypothetical protein OSJ69_22395, partial [Acetatifactor sp.]|nr:hypothetical protein [Acetatifactor sp.]